VHPKIVSLFRTNGGRAQTTARNIFSILASPASISGWDAKTREFVTRCINEIPKLRHTKRIEVRTITFPPRRRPQPMSGDTRIRRQPVARPGRTDPAGLGPELGSGPGDQGGAPSHYRTECATMCHAQRRRLAPAGRPNRGHARSLRSDTVVSSEECRRISPSISVDMRTPAYP
jgi:hypothetical protein